MRFYNINTFGKLLLERNSGVPVYDPNDESRLIYDSLTQRVLFADSTTYQTLAITGQIADYVTFEALDNNGDVGTTANTVAEGNHTHPGTSLVAPLGYFMRSPFYWQNGTSLQVTRGATYHSNGSTERLVHAGGDLSFTFGPGGSNASSSALGASQWHYLYIDDSSLSGDTFAATDLLNSTTAPTWSISKGAWYNGNNRCIGVFKTTAGSTVREFWNSGDDCIIWSDYTSLYSANPGTSFTDIIPSLPVGSLKVPVTFHTDFIGYVSDELEFFWRMNSSSTSIGILIGGGKNIATADNDESRIINTTDVVVDPVAQRFEVRCNFSNGNIRFEVLQNGYFLPYGM